jgi:hypothetical protein
MWQQTYTPIGNSLPLSALLAAIPIFTHVGCGTEVSDSRKCPPIESIPSEPVE